MFLNKLLLQVERNSKPVLNIVNISKRFECRSKTVHALQNISLHAFSGETLVLLGPNGSGKTTLIKTIINLITPDTGNVEVFGIDDGTSATLGCLLDGGAHLYQKLTVIENIEYAAALQGLSAKTTRLRIDDLLCKFDLHDKARVKASTLSRGMQQKVALIACLIAQPRVLILDEPTLGLDINACDELLATIQKIQSLGVAVIFATHQMDIAEKIANRVAILYRGRLLLFASLEDVLAQYTDDGFVLRMRAEPSTDFISHGLLLGVKRTGDREFLLPNDAGVVTKYLEGITINELDSICRRGAGLESAFRSILIANQNV